jgi:hypothetical protein
MKNILLFSFVILCLSQSLQQVYAVDEIIAGNIPVDLKSQGYLSPLNPFIRSDKGDDWYECTRYAFGRTHEKTGITLTFSQNHGRHGGTWYDLVNNPELKRGAEPQSNSLAIWEYGTYGHVAFVEEVNNGTITISESNWANPTDGKYNGTREFTKESIKKRGNYVLVGYIYLGSSVQSELAPPVNMRVDPAPTDPVQPTPSESNSSNAELRLPALPAVNTDSSTNSQSQLMTEASCHPFYDVCPGEWFSPPVSTLWSKRVLFGYDDGRSGEYRPYQAATRAEFSMATVRAIPNVSIPTPGQQPFLDVGLDSGFAGHVDYLKTKDIISGCNPDKTLFCPQNSITRAEAVKIVVLAFPRLHNSLKICQNSSQSARFPDVSNDAWYAPYICAANLASLVGGYSDGNFRPNRYISRAEMAKIICVAAYGASECIESGNKQKPIILGVTPKTATFGQAVTLSVRGLFMPVPLNLSLPGCNAMAAIAGGTADRQQFTCTPSASGTLRGQVKDSAGKILFTFSLNVPEVCKPSVTAISPLQAVLNQNTTFTVQGACLPDTTAFWIGECANMAILPGGTETQRRYQCTPSYTSGVKEGVVKDRTGGNTLRDFSVNVSSNVVVAPPPSCTPSVTSVTPSSATLGTPVVFTVSGSCLPDTTAFWVDECASVTALSGGTETQRRFQCTPSYSHGYKNGMVKDRTGGNTLRDFSVNVSSNTVVAPPPSCTPSVTSVTPSSATLGTPVVFTVNGSCLPNTTAFWVDECASVTALSGGTETQRRFQCTPSYSHGYKNGLVKDRTSGTELRSFSVNVQACSHRVDSVSPLSARFNQATVFTVDGCLPDSTAFWIAECEGMTILSGGTMTQKQYRCTPSHSTGSKQGVVKDRSGGRTLRDFTLNVQR